MIDVHFLKKTWRGTKHRGCNILIVKVYLYFVGCVLRNYQPKNEHEWHKIEIGNFNLSTGNFISH